MDVLKEFWAMKMNAEEELHKLSVRPTPPVKPVVFSVVEEVKDPRSQYMHWLVMVYDTYTLHVKNASGKRSSVGGFSRYAATMAHNSKFENIRIGVVAQREVFQDAARTTYRLLSKGKAIPPDLLTGTTE
jgi:hypothetical protein